MLELPLLRKTIEHRVNLHRSEEPWFDSLRPGSELGPPDDAAPMDSRILGGQVTRGNAHHHDLDGFPSRFQPTTDEIH